MYNFLKLMPFGQIIVKIFQKKKISSIQLIVLNIFTKFDVILCTCMKFYLKKKTATTKNMIGYFKGFEIDRNALQLL